ncbi:hypothetical protein GCM10022416_30390 [Actinomadura keratinilytica]|uniref:Uncharacterized protein n=1 Tax=Actinomadura keratinilytica TaxID=547461 RepID=A0ABP7YVF2_9ACTN
MVNCSGLGTNSTSPPCQNISHPVRRDHEPLGGEHDAGDLVLAPLRRRGRLGALAGDDVARHRPQHERRRADRHHRLVLDVHAVEPGVLQRQIGVGVLAPLQDDSPRRQRGELTSGHQMPEQVPARRQAVLVLLRSPSHRRPRLPSMPLSFTPPGRGRPAVQPLQVRMTSTKINQFAPPAHPDTPQTPSHPALRHALDH